MRNVISSVLSASTLLQPHRWALMQQHHHHHHYHHSTAYSLLDPSRPRAAALRMMASASGGGKRDGEDARRREPEVAPVPPAPTAWEPPPGFKDWDGDIDPSLFEDDDDEQQAAAADEDEDELLRHLGEVQPERRRAVAPPRPRAAAALEAELAMPRGSCMGCGARFQSEDDAAPGFVPGDVIDARQARVDEGGGAVGRRRMPVCQRCHGLRYQNRLPADALRVGSGDAAHAALQPDFFMRLLRGIAQQRCVVVAIVDLFDFHGSLVPELAQVVGPSNPLVLVANKVAPAPAPKPRPHTRIPRPNPDPTQLIPRPDPDPTQRIPRPDPGPNHPSPDRDDPTPHPGGPAPGGGARQERRAVGGR